MTIGLAPDETLLVLKVAFLVLLYGFIILIVRSATKDLGSAPQESIILGAEEADAQRAKHSRHTSRLLVIASPELEQGKTIELTVPTVVGRDARSGLRLDRDEFASARHARIEPRANGVWLDDLGSTNGTFVNGSRLKKGRLLRPGDVVRIGGTELQVQQ